jgi:membrane fusion protein (multidrug efflux system)
MESSSEVRVPDRNLADTKTPPAKREPLATPSILPVPGDPNSAPVNREVGREPEPVSVSPAKKKPSLIDTAKKHQKILVPVAALLVLGLCYWMYTLFTTETTDDAYVTNHVHVISSRVNGAVVAVLVNDNQLVKKGDVLVKLDPADFAVQEKIAQAAAINAHNDLTRWNDHGFLHPNEQLQKSQDVAAALTADANLEKAQLQLKYTQILAPEDGKVGNRAVETGQQVQVGQALMATVDETPWVVANFKEGQVAHIHIGQKVKVSVDAVPSHNFTGTVDSIAPGSGATFALLPPDNATGNFTKIVQRIPVKIIFDAETLKGFENLLAPGMSTEVTVYH